jgi:hypothetical protein
MLLNRGVVYVSALGSGWAQGSIILHCALFSGPKGLSCWEPHDTRHPPTHVQPRLLLPATQSRRKADRPAQAGSSPEPLYASAEEPSRPLASPY